ncbi:MAG: LysR family transcriptional regulator [Pseudobdellovibrionaceae bacterium]
MKNLFDIEGLFLFTKVVEAGSFAEVSKKLKIPKATLSRKISQLEAELGVQLLVRSTRNLQPTEIGRDFLQRALVILAAIEDSRSLVSKATDNPQDLLRISAGVEFGLCVLNPLVNDFCKEFPQLNVELDLTGRLVDLIYEGFDLGIRIGPLPDSTLGSRKLGSFSYGVFAAPKLIKEMGLAKKPSDLKNWPKLSFNRVRHSQQWRLIYGTSIETIKVEPRVLSNNYWVLRNAAISGLGAAFMPSFLASDAIKNKNLQQILPNWRSEEIPVHAIYPSQKFLSTKVRTFIDFIKDRIKIPDVR